MKPKQRTRRAKPSGARRLRRFWIAILFSLAIVAAAAGFVTTWRGFAPQAVTVGGNHIVPRSEILMRAAISPRVNLWLQSPSAMQRRIEGIPYVDEATVRRVPPATIAIWVTERVPLAVLCSAGACGTIDRDLRVLAPASEDAALVRFVVRDKVSLQPGTFLTQSSVAALRSDYEALTAERIAPVELSFDRFGGLIVRLRNAVTILLGDDADLAAKIRLIDPILSQAVHGGKRIDTLDLRAPNAPVAVYK